VLGLLLACPGLFVPAEADEPPSNDGTLYLELHNGGILRDAVRVHPRRMEEFTIDFSPRELANSELPASIRVEDVYRGLLVDALRHPAPGPALVSGWQQQVVDLATGQPVNEETFALWLERRGRMGAGTTSYSGVPRHSARKIDDAMRLQGRDCYTEVERQVVEELAARDVETLVPIAALYGAVYGYQTIPSPLFWLRETNRELLLDLVELHYEETGNRPLYIAQLLALVDMQRSMVLYQDGDKALGLLDYILDLEPDHAIARYWAGYLSEKFGEYRKAVHHYERYLEEDDDLEVRLRLGVNRLRAGEEDAGRAGLEVIARDQQAPRWMRLLAWSELASAFGDSNPRRAEALLVEAIEAFPADPGLRLQLAYHHRISAWDASVAELERALELGPAQEGAGPRVLYERPREEGLAANRAWLARQVAERASRLFETLDVLEGTWRRQLRKERNVVQHCQELLERGR
jgi:tetratricopeptide (TPR) repeat protein